jgi:hypothetical protein
MSDSIHGEFSSILASLGRYLITLSTLDNTIDLGKLITASARDRGPEAPGVCHRPITLRP